MDTLGIESDGLEIEEVGNEISLEAPTFFNIIPKEGLYLSLDVSKNSTGITYVENGEKITGNIVLENISGVHKEVLQRRALKRDLLELIKGKEFDLIIIEDAFVGENADTVRLLFALNTAIDEIILDGLCSCKNFIRVNNQQWKSWLYTLDTAGVTKGLNDKEKIRLCLEILGVSEEGEGFQDRLDSTGILVGYFLKGRSLEKENKLFRKRKVTLSDVEASYDVDSGYLLYGRDDIDRSKIEFLEYKKISKSRMLELLSDNPDKIFITENLVKLGNLGVDLGLEVIEDGGYFAFWVNPKKKKKYLGKEENS